MRLGRDELVRRADDILLLQHAAYRREAALIGDDRIPTLAETQADIVAAQLQWIAVLDGQRIVAVLGYASSSAGIEIDRLFVDQEYERRGLARQLLQDALADGSSAAVATGRDNLPARRLYESLGFSHERDLEVEAGLWIARYRRAAVRL